MTRAADDPLHAQGLKERADLALAAVLRTLLFVLSVLVAITAFSSTTLAGFAVLCGSLAFVLWLHILQRRGHSFFRFQ